MSELNLVQKKTISRKKINFKINGLQFHVWANFKRGNRETHSERHLQEVVSVGKLRRQRGMSVLEQRCELGGQPPGANEKSYAGGTSLRRVRNE